MCKFPKTFCFIISEMMPIFITQLKYKELLNITECYKMNNILKFCIYILNTCLLLFVLEKRIRKHTFILQLLYYEGKHLLRIFSVCFHLKQKFIIMNFYIYLINFSKFQKYVRSFLYHYCFTL